jgi:hypothetical protein
MSCHKKESKGPITKKKATAKTRSEVLKIFHVITKNADNIGVKNRATLSATCRQLSAKALILLL